MGTTAEKLKYLNETKAEIKKALETPYNVMRDYPELVKKYIDNQPTKVVTDGICGNAVDVPVKTIETNGNIRQETTEGYQLLNLQSGMQNGITYYVDDEGYFYISGTCTSDRITLNLNEMVLNGTYTFTSKSISGGGINCALKDNTSEYKTIFWANNNNNTKEVNVISKDLVCYLTNGATYNSKIKLMLVSGSQEKDVEPYTGGIPSPNPDYPQEITNVGEYDNLFDKNNIISGSYVSDGNGAFVSDSTSKRTDYIEIQASSYYYIYSDKTTGNWGAWYDKDKKFISGITLGGKNEGTVNSPANAKYMAFTVSYQGNLADYSNIKINETAIKIRQSGKNLFDKDNQDMFLKGLTPDNIGKIVVSPTNTSTSNYLVTIIVPCLPDSTYIISRYVEGKTFFVYESSKKDLKVGDNVTFLKRNNNTGIINEKITTGTNAKYLLVKIYNTYVTEPNTYNDLISSVQIEKGSTATPYEPYHEPIITPINLQGNILSKVRDVKDILKINRNGEVEIKKNIGKVILDGTEKLSLSGATTDEILVVALDISGAEDGYGYSNYFVYSSTVKQNSIAVYNNGKFLRFCVNKNEFFNLEAFKAWVKSKYDEGNPVLVYYKLATPQIITLPSISPIELWQGTNIFKLITNLDTDFEVEYVVDKDSVLNEVQTAILEAEI
nr:MAG TPA: hypothetical protein [Caudoviricetes sp.]